MSHLLNPYRIPEHAVPDMEGFEGKKKMLEIIIKGKWRGKTFLHENATSLLSKVHIKVET